MLARQQVQARNLQLLLRGVAVQLDHLHAIPKRQWYGLQHIGRGDEHHRAQVKGQAQVVVTKRRVLCRVQHLQQRRRRVAMGAGRELVDLIEHQDCIACAAAAQRLQHEAWHGPDVGAAMPPNLGLVVNTAQ